MCHSTVRDEDFLESPVPEVTFASGSNTSSVLCVTYTIIDDEALEVDHAFTVEINSTNPGTLDGVFISMPSATTVNIEDNEGNVVVV